MNRSIAGIVITAFAVLAAAYAGCESYCYPPHELPNGNGHINWDCTTCPSDVSSCPCYLPKLPGGCRGYFPSWYFNSQTGVCEEFIYGGCGGNGNRFSSQVECQRACRNVCTLPIDERDRPCPPHISGPFAYTRRYTYAYGFNGVKCVRFRVYSCGTAYTYNANNFRTMQECKDTCDTSTPH